MQNVMQALYLTRNARGLPASARRYIRFYYLGKKYENKIEHFGCKQTYLPEEPMIL